MKGLALSVMPRDVKFEKVQVHICQHVLRALSSPKCHHSFPVFLVAVHPEFCVSLLQWAETKLSAWTPPEVCVSLLHWMGPDQE